MKLEWKKDQLTLDVVMRKEDVKVNQFDDSRSAAVFVEPVIPGYERVNLADMARAAPERQPHDSAAHASHSRRAERREAGQAGAGNR